MEDSSLPPSLLSLSLLSRMNVHFWGSSCHDFCKATSSSVVNGSDHSYIPVIPHRMFCNDIKKWLIQEYPNVFFKCKLTVSRASPNYTSPLLEREISVGPITSSSLCLFAAWPLWYLSCWSMSRFFLRPDLSHPSTGQVQTGLEKLRLCIEPVFLSSSWKVHVKEKTS